MIILWKFQINDIALPEQTTLHYLYQQCIMLSCWSRSHYITLQEHITLNCSSGTDHIALPCRNRNITLPCRNRNITLPCSNRSQYIACRNKSHYSALQEQNKLHYPTGRDHITLPWQEQITLHFPAGTDHYTLPCRNISPYIAMQE
jgi:hypothetical protein